MQSRLHNSCWLTILILLFVSTVGAQVQVEGVSTSLSGDLLFGYGGSFSNGGDSTHNLLLGGNGQFNGSYYHPNFLSFSVRPYYNRSQDNSAFQLTNNNYGLTSEVSFFSGSHFPGTFIYTDEHNNTGTLGLPGTSALATNGTGSAWTIGWSALIPKLPTLSVGYTQSQGTAQVYGTHEQSSSRGDNLNLASSYSIAGFSLNANYLKMNIAMDEPGFVSANEQLGKSQTDSSSLLVNVSHRLPMSGNFIATASRFDGNYAFGGSGPSTDNTTHTYTTSASILPGKRVGLSVGGTYSDNLSGSLNQQLIQQQSAPLVSLGTGTDSLTIYGSSQVALFRGFSINANANHIVQHWAGLTHEATQFSGTATYNYTHQYLGSLTFNGGMVDTATEQGNGGVGLIGNLNFSKKIHAWDVGARFGYSQSVETLLATYTTSSYDYGANVRRRLGNYTLTSYFSAAHSGFEGSNASNHSENIGSTFGTRRYSANASWGESRGMSILSANGLTAAPTSLPIVLLTPDSIVSYNGSHYSFGGSFSALRRLVIVGNYSYANNSTIAGLKNSFGETSMLNATLRYPFRKLYFTAGYTRLGQSVITPGGAPVLISSYYFGISRWFDFF